MTSRRLWLVLLVSVWSGLGATAAPLPLPPEADSGFHPKALAHGARAMVSTAHPLATAVALKVLRQGGNAIDAAVAAAWTLGLVEPQSSGPGGGGYLLTWQARERRLMGWDGRETAPHSAYRDMFLDENGEPLPFQQVLASGRAVGVPGMPAMLWQAHAKAGRLPWARLLEPARRLAEHGFPVSPRLERMLAEYATRLDDPAARKLFLLADGSVPPVGRVLRNPDYARTLTDLADHGTEGFYRGSLAQAIRARVAQAAGTDLIDADDMTSYTVRTPPALCGPYRQWKVCGMPPSTSGGTTVLSMLGLLEGSALESMRPDSVAAIHLFSEAGRLAYADRERYLGDPQFAKVPVQGLLAPSYLAARRSLIQPQHSMGRAEAGVPEGAEAMGVPEPVPEQGTTHLVVADAEGNVVTMTLSVEAAFGSVLFVGGFFLNNQLTDFSWRTNGPGMPLANAVQPHKRPRSAMSPTVVFDARQRVVLALGSAGGSAIINHVAQSLVAVLDWRLPLDQALALGHYGSRNGPTELEAGRDLERQATVLRAMDHEVVIGAQTSGLHALQRDPKGGWWGAADPRRDGMAAGY